MRPAGEQQALAGVQFHTRARHTDKGFAVSPVRPAAMTRYEHMFDQSGRC